MANAGLLPRGSRIWYRYTGFWEVAWGQFYQILHACIVHGLYGAWRQTSYPSACTHACAQEAKGFQEAAYTAASESCELKLQILKWRKRTAILRLRLSNLEETVSHIQDNAVANAKASREALDENAALRQNLQLALEYFDAERATTCRLQVGGGLLGWETGDIQLAKVWRMSNM